MLDEMGRSIQIRAYTEADELAVVRLWEECGLTRPWNDPRRDIARKLVVRRDLFLVAAHAGAIVGTVMVGYEGHRGWINYLAVAPAYQKQQLGRALMAEAETLLLREGCPKVNLQVRAGNEGVVAFYRRLGYDVEEMVSMGKRLIADLPGGD
ncbi:MAG: GNAT family acetyltransferase [Myxococcota bacterium]